MNCIDLSVQFKWVPTTYASIKISRQKYTGCIINLKTRALLDCALIGVCSVIKLNTVSLSLCCRHMQYGLLFHMQLMSIQGTH